MFRSIDAQLINEFNLFMVSIGYVGMPLDRFFRGCEGKEIINKFHIFLNNDKNTYDVLFTIVDAVVTHSRNFHIASNGRSIRSVELPSDEFRDTFIKLKMKV